MSIIERAMQRSASSRQKADLENQPVADSATTTIQSLATTGEVALPVEPEANLFEAAEIDPAELGGAVSLESASSFEPTSGLQSLNFALMRRQGLLVPDDGRSVLAEEFRMLKRPILANAFAESGQRIGRRNVVMITSALPREGKTFTVINLALSVAMELQRTVLLIDADVVKPSIPARLGLTVDQGLTDLLEHPEQNLSAFLVRTSVPNLVVLGAGRSHGRATELLASAAMARLVDELATRYPDRLVLFDSPPMLSTSESSVLARHMGQVVLTVQAAATPRAALSRVVKMLDACDLVVPVLNRAAGTPGMNYAMGYYLDGKYGRQ